MISKILSGQELPVDLLATTESFFRDAAEALATAMETTRKGAAEADPRALDVAITALKKSFHDVMDERRRLEKLRKDIVGAVENRELDLADARLEVSRRLACIRAARRD